MSDKARAEFEEWIKGSALTQDLSRMPRSESGLEEIYLNPDANLAFFAWLAAKERYEPMWIPVSERLPEIDQYVVWSCDDGYWEERFTHWAVINPPSTQGEE